MAPHHPPSPKRLGDRLLPLPDLLRKVEPAEGTHYLGLIRSPDLDRRLRESLGRADAMDPRKRPSKVRGHGL